MSRGMARTTTMIVLASLLQAAARLPRRRDRAGRGAYSAHGSALKQCRPVCAFAVARPRLASVTLTTSLALVRIHSSK